ncbi:hypothetical protein GX48_08138 [Paracoccidioides brasiliensis]|nr:hypothetical protein GX48_08138 [Paracoccidioides brasiliensis]
MKITVVASLLLTIAGLAAASPLAQPDDVPIVAVEPDNGPSITSKPGASCSASGRVTCSFSNGQRDQSYQQALHPAARQEAFKNSTIKNGFKGTGLVLYEPNEIFLHIYILSFILLLSDTSHGSESFYTPQMPKNVRQLELQSSKIKQCMELLYSFDQSSLYQSIKRCQLATYSAAILAKKNKELRAAG